MIQAGFRPNQGLLPHLLVEIEFFLLKAIYHSFSM